MQSSPRLPTLYNTLFDLRVHIAKPKVRIGSSFLSRSICAKKIYTKIAHEKLQPFFWSDIRRGGNEQWQSQRSNFLYNWKCFSGESRSHVHWVLRERIGCLKLTLTAEGTNMCNAPNEGGVDCIIISFIPQSISLGLQQRSKFKTISLFCTVLSTLLKNIVICL